MIYLFLCSAITGALKGNNSPVLPIMMTCFFIYSAITGALKIGIQDLSFRGRLRAWWERLVFDYNIKSEQWWSCFTYTLYVSIHGVGKLCLCVEKKKN
jgi:membrane associated rhomboid family serine protease